MKRLAIVGLNEKAGIKNFLSILNELKTKMNFEFDLFLFCFESLSLSEVPELPV